MEYIILDSTDHLTINIPGIIYSKIIIEFFLNFVPEDYSRISNQQ